VTCNATNRETGFSSSFSLLPVRSPCEFKFRALEDRSRRRESLSVLSDEIREKKQSMQEPTSSTRASIYHGQYGSRPHR
jgi:hypothetical protein